ncbi:MAG: DUF1838 family protein [Chloroflexaceae bacterium]|nr:DUF1838 family protein [Chloroflexaceae bacterium]
MPVPKPTITDEQFVKIRCGLEGKTYYFEATGAMYAHPFDDDEPQHLFDFLGVDISRCLQDPASSQWVLLSRKLSLYLDPKTGDRLRHWTNPWTGETLNVMHRSYDYQEFMIPKELPAHIAPEMSAVSLDVNGKLPNPLAANPKYAAYSPEKYLQSADAYKFIFRRRFWQTPPLELAIAGPWFCPTTAWGPGNPG